MEGRLIADLIIHGNTIFTGKSNELFSGAVVVKNNKIIDVCSVGVSEAYEGPQTKVLRFEDELIMPGFHDFHVHVFFGGLHEESVSLFDARSEREAALMVKQFADQHPDHQWVLGFRWHHVNWDEPKLPSRYSLDELIPDRPVFLLNAALHSAWVNSKALEMLGIDEQTPSPPFGEIVKDKNGQLTGLLVESAVSLGVEKAYKLPKERSEKILRDFLDKAKKLGITSVGDMFPLPGFEIGDLDLYRQFEENGNLSTRIFFLTTLNGDLSYAKKLRDKYNSEKLRFSGVKQFLDGVPSLYTAFLVDPYADNPSTRGYPFIEPSTIMNWVSEADKEGFRVRLHAVGDGAVRLALDAYEHAQKMNGKRDSRHTIEHIELIHPDDIHRFKSLGVVASMQPEHMAFSDTFEGNALLSRFGPERSDYVFPINSLSKAGACIAFGSDFPVVELDPLLEIYRAVTRLFNDGQPQNGWNPSEKIKLADALRYYTLGSAYANFVEDKLGTLEKGKLADIIVFDRNLFSIQPDEILEAKVKLTISDGQIIYEANC